MTDPDIDEGTRWSQAQDLFLQLSDTPPADRAAALKECASSDPELARWVSRLLKHDPGTSLTGTGEGDPRRFGPYEVVRTIGRGGMGEVVVARRADGEYEREVAIKLLREDTASQALVQRFLRERQTLASLDHEYIARLLDGGTTERGEPYLVMEYVEGDHADVFAAHLELHDRLRLFVRIGGAVQHAHDRGVVHRDLKPSNVLVRSDGRPRLLDFGIARPYQASRVEGAERRLTETGHRLFTPEFASPEQIRGEEVTPSSDQFALGVLLYVFLCGEGPWSISKGLHDLERTICDLDPSPPSRKLRGTGRRSLSGDLDAIVMQCLEKRPARRYADVSALCDDIERYLAGKPVRARRTGSVERGFRYLRRNPLYAVASILAAVALVASLAASRADERSEERLVGLVESIEDRVGLAQTQWEDGLREESKENLRSALSAVSELPGEEELHARVLVQMAVNASMEEEWEVSLGLLDRAEALLESVTSVNAWVAGRLLNAQAYSVMRQSPDTYSGEAGLVALNFALEHLPPGDEVRVDAMLSRADELRLAERPAEARDLLDEAIEEVREIDPKRDLLGILLNERAVYLARSDRTDEAVADYESVLEILAWHHGERHPTFAKVRLNLASTLFRAGRYEDARAEFLRSLEVCRVLELKKHIAANLHMLARTDLWLEEYATAETFVAEAIVLRRELDDPMNVDRSMVVLGLIQAARGRRADAVATLAPILERAEDGWLLPDVEEHARSVLATLLPASDGD